MNTKSENEYQVYDGFNPAFSNDKLSSNFIVCDRIDQAHFRTYRNG